MSERHKPRVGFWIAAGLFLVLVVYPLSVGPADWLYFHGFIPKSVSPWFYRFYAPVDWVVVNSPEPICNAFAKYEHFWSNLGSTGWRP